MYKHFFKRVLDFCGASVALVVLSPCMFTIIILLYIANKRSGVFFTQVRPGKNANPIKVIKFKTMNDSKDDSGKLLPDIKRVTRIGRFFRSTSLDELPQLINVLKGDMSIIGPRPLMTSYLNLYTSEQARRHEVKPGMTGWAQCNGRNGISWEKRFEFDIWYIDNVSFWVDLKIFFITIKKVLCREGIDFNVSSDCEAFNGHN